MPIKAIHSGKTIVSSQAQARALRRAMVDTSKQAKKLFETTTKTWQTRVAFTEQILPASAVVGTSNDIYHYVSSGTRSHIIRPRRAGGRLRFQTGFTPKTSVGSLSSGSGGRSGANVFRRGVRHPGSKARKYPEQVAKLIAPVFQRAVRAAVTSR